MQLSLIKVNEKLLTKFVGPELEMTVREVKVCLLGVRWIVLALFRLSFYDLLMWNPPYKGRRCRKDQFGGKIRP